MILRRLAALGVMVAAVVAVAPARAQENEPPQMCAVPGGSTATTFGGGIASPPDQAELLAPGVPIGAEFEPPTSAPTAQITCVSAVVIPEEGQPIPQVGRSVSTPKLEWTSPDRTYNGRYRVQFTVTARRSPPFEAYYNQRPSRTVYVLAPAKAPAEVDVEPKGVNTALVSWDRNTELDVFAYVLQRKNSAGEVTTIEGPTQPTEAERVTYTDKTPAGGAYTYTVVAVRPGKPDAPVLSPASAPAEATIAGPTPATTPGGTAGGGGGTSGSGSGSTTGGGAPGGTTATTTPARADLSSFGALLDQRRRATTTVTTPEPDTGFGETLPFQAQDEPALGDESGEELGTDEEAQGGTGQETVTDDSDRRRALASIAGALIFFVLFLHLRLLKSEAERMDDLDTEEPFGDLVPIGAPVELASVPTQAELDVLDVPLGPESRREQRRAERRRRVAA